MTLDEIREAVAELSNDVEFANEVDKIIRENHTSAFEKELVDLTSMIEKDDKFVSVFIASKFKLYYFLYTLEKQYEIEYARVNIDSGVLNTMTKIKNYHDIKHRKIC